MCNSSLLTMCWGKSHRSSLIYQYEHPMQLQYKHPSWQEKYFLFLLSGTESLYPAYKNAAMHNMSDKQSFQSSLTLTFILQQDISSFIRCRSTQMFFLNIYFIFKSAQCHFYIGKSSHKANKRLLPIVTTSGMFWRPSLQMSTHAHKKNTCTAEHIHWYTEGKIHNNVRLT